MVLAQFVLCHARLACWPRQRGTRCCGVSGCLCGMEGRGAGTVCFVPCTSGLLATSAWNALLRGERGVLCWLAEGAFPCVGWGSCLVAGLRSVRPTLRRCSKPGTQATLPSCCPRPPQATSAGCCSPPAHPTPSSSPRGWSVRRPPGSPTCGPAPRWARRPCSACAGMLRTHGRHTHGTAGHVSVAAAALASCH